jgi:hypothetical protein
MVVFTEAMSTWLRLVQLKEASRPENISFECRGVNEPHSPRANDIEGSERHRPVLDIARPESVSSDYGGTQSTLLVPPKQPPRSRSAQSGRALNPEGDLYRHSYVMWNESLPRREVSQAIAVSAVWHK